MYANRRTAVSVCRNAGYDISQAQSRYFGKKEPPRRKSLATGFVSRKSSEMRKKITIIAGVPVIVINIRSYT